MLTGQRIRLHAPISGVPVSGSRHVTIPKAATVTVQRERLGEPWTADVDWAGREITVFADHLVQRGHCLETDTLTMTA